MSHVIGNSPFENTYSNPTPPNTFVERNAIVEQVERTTDFSIPAGAVYVKISNAGEIGGGLLAVAEINGEDLDVMAHPIEFHAINNQADQETILSPEYVIVTNGAMIHATVHR